MSDTTDQNPAPQAGPGSSGEDPAAEPGYLVYGRDPSKPLLLDLGFW